jgi:flagellar export protein FliJ
MERQMGATHAEAHLAWHRVWIHRLERSRSALGSAVAEKEAHAAAATAECAAARQRLESLERLREKALSAWEDAERAREQRELDAVATMRYQATATAAAREEAAVRQSAMRSTP